MVTNPLRNGVTRQTLAAQNDRPLERGVKQGIDFVGSAALIFVLSPLFLLVAGLILLLDGAPVIHYRRVIGPGGEFAAYKFRTMIRNADEVLAGDAQLSGAFSEQFKLKKDPRVTRLGRYLRKCSLDELPQLVNVLKGQMSLVGPRMITTAELVKYVPWERLLLTVKPGITGYWQVRGRQKLSYEERVRMDIQYITNWSLLLDLRILLQTPSQVIRGEGAY